MNTIVGLNVCRTCMKSADGTSIFSSATMLEQFRYATQLKVDVSDGLPTMLCENCILRMKVAFEFRRQSIVSDQHLRLLIQKFNNELTKAADSTSFTANDEDIKIFFETAADSESNSEMATKTTDCQQTDEKLLQHDEDSLGTHSKCDEFEEMKSEIKIENSSDTEYIDVDPFEDESQFFCEISAKEFESKAGIERHMLSHSGYDCKMCNQIFFDKSAFRKHTALHTEVQPYKCEVCDKEFAYNEMLSNHMKTHTGEKNHECEICHSQFNWDHELKLHMNTHMTDRPHKCDICGKGYIQLSGLKVHMRTHTGERPYKCKECGQGFRQASSLRIHVLIHTGEKPHKCDVCGRAFTQKKTLTHHMRRHTGEKPFECEECGQRFRLKEALKSHLFTHEGSRSYKCKDCDKSFSQNHSLLAHIRRHHTFEKPFACDHCDESFFENDKLTRHILQSHAEVDIGHVCRICDHISVSESELLSHIQAKHDGAENVKPPKKSEPKSRECTKCNEKFLTQYEMAQHMLKKCGIKPFTCNICANGFTQKASLDRHRLTHTGEKPYQCDICDRSFTQSKTLTQHKRIHTGEKPFICEQCGRAFRAKDILKRHLERDHTESVFLCRQCGKDFPIRSHLKMHVCSILKFGCALCPKSFLKASGLERHMTQHRTDKGYECEICGRCISRHSNLKKHRMMHLGKEEKNEEDPTLSIGSEVEV